MIRYALRCATGHDFEGWFRNSDAFDAQVAAGEVACPGCGATDVEKSLMAPALAKGGSKGGDKGAGEAVSATNAPGPSLEGQALAADPKTKALVEAMRRLRRHVIENADYVGPRFAEEARKIHYEESERRDIYGEASPEETKALIDEGIEIAPLPVLPDDKN